jgi:E3 ubiquitin-protein ligase MUL1
MCIVCYSKERSVACVPCGHKCLCEDCGTKETMSTANGCPCPMCREEVMMFMKVFE